MEPDNAPYSTQKSAGVGGWVDLSYRPIRCLMVIINELQRQARHGSLTSGVSEASANKVKQNEGK